MSTILNLIPADVKPNIAVQNSSKIVASTATSKNEFAKVLNKQADKNETDDNSAKTKEDNSSQLMAAIAGLVLPTNVNVLSGQNSNQAAADVNSDNENNQMMKIMPMTDTKNQMQQTLPILDVVDQLKQAVSELAGTNQLKLAVPVADTKNQLQQTIASAMDTKKQMPSNTSSVDVNNLLLNAIVSDNKTSLPEAASAGKVDLSSTVKMNTSLNQLTALLTKMINGNASVDGKNDAETAQIQAQLKSMSPTQIQQLIQQIQQAANSAKKTDNLTATAAILPAIPTLVVGDNNNGAGKTITKSVDTKTIAADLDSTAVKSADINELIGSTMVNVKPLTGTPNVLSEAAKASSSEKINIAGLESKEQLKPGMQLSDQTMKNSDAFASLLNQQTAKTDGQVNIPDVKQVLQQPVTDPYNINSQIIDQARLIEGQKNTEMIIQLKPEHLGELTFKVTVENGVVSASFHSNNSEVRNVIEASLQQLKQDMSNQGLKVENVSVYAGLGEFFSNGQRESQQKTQIKFRNKKIEGDFLDALDSTKTAEAVSDGSGVDYRV